MCRRSAGLSAVTSVPPSDSDDRDGGGIKDVAADLQEAVQQSAPAAAAAYTLIGAIIVLGALGYALDAWLGTDPWLLLSGLLMGILVGFYELIRYAWGRGR
jgi:F0F1-type ATP synthase assembly protein I